MTIFTSQDLQAHVVGTPMPQSYMDYVATLPEMLRSHSATHTIAPPIVCADGFKVSVQASETHYCTPRNNVGPYDTVELGFPSERVDAWMDYCDDSENPTGTVYARVPVDLVVLVINDHGGVRA